MVPEEDKETIRQAVSQLQTAMDGNSDELKTIYASLKDTILNVGAKLYQQGGASSSSSLGGGRGISSGGRRSDCRVGYSTP